jgi:VIT1/CCC1 family predicted Fe2+/Mn2+ transporter
MTHKSSELLQNIILGGQDGLVNVLGLSIGVAGATGNRDIVLVSGIAAMLAESISMGAVAHTTGRTAVKCEQKNRQDAEFSEQDATKLIAAGKKAGIPPKKLSLVEQLVAHKEDGHRIPLERGALVWLSTMCGSAIPIAPYLFAGVADALPFSLLLALAALFITGAIRAKHTGEDWKASGFEMALVGGIATAAGYVIGSVLKVTI